MKKLWIATELFYPEETSTAYILTKIANKLSNNYKITVYCGQPSYQLTEEENSKFYLDGRVNVERLNSGGTSSNSLKSRGKKSLILSFKIFFKLLKNVKKKDSVFIVTNPISLILLISFAKKIKNFKLKILVHDVFPENTIPAGIIKSKNSFFYICLKYFFDLAYSSADELFVLGRDMEVVITEKINRFKNNTKITIVENWGDVDSIYPLAKSDFLTTDSPFLNKIVFQYAGNIGRVQGLLDFLKIIQNITNPNLLFYFVGEGAVKHEMENFVSANNITNVKFDGAYQRSMQNEVLNTSDVSIITLSEGMFGLGVPSKAYNILAAGKPIFYIGDEHSEISILIKENDIGYAFNSSEKEEIIMFFNNFGRDSLADLQSKSKNARDLAVNNYTEDKILNKFLNTI